MIDVVDQSGYYGSDVPLGSIGGGAPAGGGDWFGQNAPPPGAAAPPAAPAAGGGQFWDQNYFAATFGSPNTPQELIALEDRIRAAGGQVLRNAAGVAGKIRTPDGRIIDVINSAGLGGRGFQWLEGDGGGGGGGNAFGSFAQGWDRNFSAPSAEDARNTPGYQFALEQGIQGLDRSAAARGTVMNGGQKQDVLNYAIGLADQTYQQRYQNALGEYKMAYDIFRNNQNDIFDRYDRLAQRGTSAAGAATT